MLPVLSLTPPFLPDTRSTVTVTIAGTCLWLPPDPTVDLQRTVYSDDFTSLKTAHAMPASVPDSRLRA